MKDLIDDPCYSEFEAADVSSIGPPTSALPNLLQISCIHYDF